MFKNLLFGYHAISKNNLWDLGNDPYFHKKPFSWGICRPNNRNHVKKDTKIFFYTFKESVGDYFLTGMMKVDKILNQIKAANESSLYCGKDFNSCPYKVESIIDIGCETCCTAKFNRDSFEKTNNITIGKRDCRCNIIVDQYGKYKNYCDGNRHLHVYMKYRIEKIYFVSYIEYSIATKDKIRLLDFMSLKTKFWQSARFYGFELERKIALQLETVLREKELKT